MGKVVPPRRTHSVYWRGAQYPYSPCHAASGLAQARRPAYQTGSNGIPRLSSINCSNGVESILHTLSERMRNSSTRLTRTLSSSSSSSSTTSISIGSPVSSPGSQAVQCVAEEKPLKRLAFVRSQGSFWLTWISMAYSTSRAMVPLPHSVIAAVENTMSEISGGFVSAASEQSEKVLHALDEKVDTVMSTASNVRETVAGDVWSDMLGALAQRPPFKYAYAAYQHAHDTVVATPIYTKALEIGGETMTKVHESRLYKSLLPLVGPFTEPTVRRIMESPTFQAVKEHLAPMPPQDAQQQHLAVEV